MNRLVPQLQDTSDLASVGESPPPTPEALPHTLPDERVTSGPQSVDLNHPPPPNPPSNSPPVSQTSTHPPRTPPKPLPARVDSDTPITRRSANGAVSYIASSGYSTDRLGLQNNQFQARSMNEQIREELQSSRLDDFPKLADKLFPDFVFGGDERPIPLLLAYLKQRGLFKVDSSSNTCSWPKGPKMTDYDSKGKQETAVSVWLNLLADHCADCLAGMGESKPQAKVPRKDARPWTGQFSATSPGGSRLARRPDGLSMPEDSVDWKYVYAGLALKSNDKVAENGVQLHDTAYNLFSAQFHRRFFIALSFNKYDLKVYYYDRTGCISSRTLNIHTNSGALAFIRVLAGIRVADHHYLGFDTTLTVDAEGKTWIQVNNNTKYEVVEATCKPVGIRGRSTIIYKCTDEQGNHYAVKDSWVDEAHENREPELLKLAMDAEVKGIVRLVDSWLVRRGDDIDSTDWIRGSRRKSGEDTDVFGRIEVRRHHRMVLTPFGEPLKSFFSGRELLLAIYNAIEAHRDLYRARILHRDISERNIMLATVNSQRHPDRKKEGLRPGFLIDLDYSVFMGREGDERRPGDRTGTLPFMAHALLRDNPPLHTFRHDLESFLWVIMFFAYFYEQPGQERRDSTSLNDHWEAWMYDFSVKPETVGTTKFWILSSDTSCREFIRLTFTPYFAGLRDCVLELRTVIVDSNSKYDEDPELCYADVLEILKRHLKGELFPEVKPLSETQPNPLKRRSRPTRTSQVKQIKSDDQEDDEGSWLGEAMEQAQLRLNIGTVDPTTHDSDSDSASPHRASDVLVGEPSGPKGTRSSKRQKVSSGAYRSSR